MIDEKKQAIENGLSAERLMNDPAFKKAVDSLKAALTDKWATSPIRDTEGQHELRLMVKLLDDLIGNLRVAMNEGTFAAEQVKIERTTVDKLRRALK
jgi:hypothetical protein